MNLTPRNVEKNCQLATGEKVEEENNIRWCVLQPEASICGHQRCGKHDGEDNWGLCQAPFCRNDGFYNYNITLKSHLGILLPFAPLDLINEKPQDDDDNSSGKSVIKWFSLFYIHHFYNDGFHKVQNLICAVRASREPVWSAFRLKLILLENCI